MKPRFGLYAAACKDPQGTMRTGLSRSHTLSQRLFVPFFSFCKRLCVVSFPLLISVPLAASNMGVALRVQLTSTPEPLHFVSLPLLYDPGTAEALCQDLGAAGDVSGILRWDGASSVFVEYACGTGVGDFALEEGMAHGVRVGLNRTVDQLVVGIHDDDFEFDFSPGSGGNSTGYRPPTTWPCPMSLDRKVLWTRKTSACKRERRCFRFSGGTRRQGALKPMSAAASSSMPSTSNRASPAISGGQLIDVSLVDQTGNVITLDLSWASPATDAEDLSETGSSLITAYSIWYARRPEGDSPATDGSLGGWTRTPDLDFGQTGGYSTDTTAEIDLDLGTSSDEVWLAIGLVFDGSGDPDSDPNSLASTVISRGLQAYVPSVGIVGIFADGFETGDTSRWSEGTR